MILFWEAAEWLANRTLLADIGDGALLGGHSPPYFLSCPCLQVTLCKRLLLWHQPLQTPPPPSACLGELYSPGIHRVLMICCGELCLLNRKPEQFLLLWGCFCQRFLSQKKRKVTSTVIYLIRGIWEVTSKSPQPMHTESQHEAWSVLAGARHRANEVQFSWLLVN